MERLIARIRIPNTSTKCSSGGRVLLHAQTLRDAENAYSGIIGLGPKSSFYELALYKLGWTFYKQDLYEEALHKYMALLDYKVSVGYDFDQKHEEEDERRVADTYRVISLSFSSLGGPDAVRDYYSSFGNRSYEDRVYSNLGEQYLAKLRYDDAAKTYKSFVALYPFHRNAPRFSMRVVETFTQGGFPQLVLESKREFASRYGLKAEYWRHFNLKNHRRCWLPEDEPEGPRDALSRRVSERAEAAEKLATIRRRVDGTATISIVSRRTPIRLDQLSTRGPSPREPGFRRSGEAI
jgi:tetratricopeptide (TPR) repeat protein